MLQESLLGRRVGVVFDGKGSRIVSAGTERTVGRGGDGKMGYCWVCSSKLRDGRVKGDERRIS